MRKLLILFGSVIGMLILANPSGASSPPVLASGAYTVAIVPGTAELVPQGKQCIVYVETRTTYTGTLEGMSETVGPVQVRFFATCEELVASGFTGIRSVSRAEEHFVGDDGTELTLLLVGRTDTEGIYQGTIVVQGDLQGVLRDEGASGVAGTYEGRLVRR